MGLSQGKYQVFIVYCTYITVGLTTFNKFNIICPLQGCKYVKIVGKLERREVGKAESWKS